MNYYVGIDGGSTYLKTALINDEGLVGTRHWKTDLNAIQHSDKILNEALQSFGLVDRKEAKWVMATGYSRRALEAADETISEISAHAAGIKLTTPEGVNPSLIIDVGGQDSKIIVLDEEGQVKNFVMNDKCAAGTGKFIEVLTEMLTIPLEEVGELSLKSKAPCDINSTCAVFAQTEVISLIAGKNSPENILAGIHYAMAKRIANMARRHKGKGDILMTGGGARNAGLVAALEEELMADIFVAREAQFNGAIGAACLGRESVLAERGVK